MDGSESDKGCSVHVHKVKWHRFLVNPPKKESQTITNPFLGDVSLLLAFKVGVLFPI